MLVVSYRTSDPGFSRRCWSREVRPYSVLSTIYPSLKGRERECSNLHMKQALSQRKTERQKNEEGKVFRVCFACVKERRAVCASQRVSKAARGVCE